MDPTEMLLEFLAALTCNDRDTATDKAEEFAGWIRHGGFLPHVVCAVGTDNTFIIEQP